MDAGIKSVTYQSNKSCSSLINLSQFNCYSKLVVLEENPMDS